MGSHELNLAWRIRDARDRQNVLEAKMSDLALVLGPTLRAAARFCSRAFPGVRIFAPTATPSPRKPQA